MLEMYVNVIHSMLVIKHFECFQLKLLYIAPYKVAILCSRISSFNVVLFVCIIVMRKCIITAYSGG